ncbi:MAG TPA: co-chaperone GroES [Candidatus Paceibacterota bacterium]|nr:co-chaperone GroES [Candidatus Paceibacterota bacterium]HRY76748.1 co-chaperone GroES [Candidatus Paceibacterota bacterium]
MLKPLADHVIIEPISEDTVTKSGIVLPDTAEKEKPQKGKIIAVGPGKINDKGERIVPEVKVGDIVLFQKYSPSEIKIDNKDYLVAREDDIMAIIS